MEGKPVISRRREGTRARLLAAALQIFSEKGVAAASIETIVEAAGFTRGAFYSNFSSKEELLIELAHQQIQGRIDAAVEGFSQLDHGLFSDGQVDLTTVGRMLVALSGESEDERQWHIFRSEFELFALRNPDQARQILALGDAYQDKVVEIVVPLLEEAGVRFLGDPSMIMRILMVAYQEAAHRAVLTSDLPFGQAMEMQLEWFSALVGRFVVPAGIAERNSVSP